MAEVDERVSRCVETDTGCSCGWRRGSGTNSWAVHRQALENSRRRPGRSLVCSIGEHAKCDGNAPNGPAGIGNPCGCGCHPALASGAVTEGLDVERLARAICGSRPPLVLENVDLGIEILGVDHHDDLQATLDALWACGVAAGMDTDGDQGPAAMVAGMGVARFARAMVEEVERLRDAYDECLS